MRTMVGPGGLSWEILFGPKSYICPHVEDPYWVLWTVPEGPPIQGTFVNRKMEA